MYDDRKLWVIEDNDGPEITSLGEVLTEAPAPAVPRPAPTRRISPLQAPRRNVARSAAPQGPRLHSAILLALAYVLGPAALVLTERGRRSGLWVGLAVVSAGAALALAGGWWSFLRGEVPAVLLPLLVLAGALTIAVAATVWSHALLLLLSARRFPTRPWPAWLQNPWTALATGLAAPGSAMALTRRPHLAALTAWWTWPGLAAALLLVQTPVMWRHREAFGNWGIGPDVVEYVLVGAAVVVVTAIVFWVSQALVGARTLAVRTGRWQGTRGDWTGIGLAAAVLVFMVVVQPGVVANDLAVYAAALADAEYRVIPVGLNTAAQRLDPGQVAYVLQGADLYVARGDLEAARGVREDLHRRMRPYLGLLAAPPEPAVEPSPVMPWTAELPSPLVRPAGGSGPTLAAARPGPAAPTVRPAVTTMHLFGPVLIPQVETESGRTAPADSMP